jgi:hypothetical protein
VSWKPVSGKRGVIACTDHGEEFPRGQSCPACTPENAKAPDERESEASALAREAAALGLPSGLGREKDADRRAKKLETLADKLARLGDSFVKSGKGAKKPGAKSTWNKLALNAYNAATKAYDAVNKPARSAESRTEAREDWQRVERDQQLALGGDAVVEVEDDGTQAGEVH